MAKWEIEMSASKRRERSVPKLTFWFVVWLGLFLTLVNLGTGFLIETVRKRIVRRADNAIYSLFINDVFNGKHALKECKAVYEREPYETMKGSGINKKKREFYIDVDSR